MTTILPVTELRERLGDVLERARTSDEPVFITRHGRAQAVLLSVDSYDRLMDRLSQTSSADWYALSQASLARVWDHPDEDVYSWEDGEPL
ncbi:MAG: type II toxin-antitoxin system Phd/YefM family antitoxin [Anaerolineae bacterium]|jgi:prevent-host-death family protein|nr:type II toxin-antitoxin system Phd/YefM family antitoxin [Anaerolineae bacterium]